MHEMNDACLCSCKCNAIKELNTWGVTCSNLDSLVDKEGKLEEKHCIHREVKCSHLVPEPDSR
jgi:hypothetical protein